MRIICRIVFLLLFVCGTAFADDSLDWGPEYYDFIINKRYPIEDETYFEEGEMLGVKHMPMFALHDMDGDGVPELIAENGCYYLANLHSNVYTYHSGRIQYLGITNERELYYFPNSPYPGLFYRWGSMGHYPLSYSTIKDGECESTLIFEEFTEPWEERGIFVPGIYKATDDDPTVDALYDLYMDGVGKEELEFFSASEIRKMGLKRFMALATDADLSGVEQLPTAGKSDTSSDASGSDNDYDSLFGSDKAECLFIDAAKSTGGDTLVTGDIFLFGDEYRYRNPDGNTLEWDVLALNEYGALLLTHYVIDCIPYEEFRHSTTWEESSLRTWMNGNFIQRYFTEAQRDAILRVRLQNPNNPKYGTYGGHNTTDRVFALSYAEGERYLTRDTINTTATEYARSKGAKLRHENKNKTVYWWLRTPGNIQQRAMITSLKNNTLDYEGNGVGTYFDDGLRNNTGVRPALWLSWAYIKDHPECVVKKPVVVIGTLIKNSVGLRKTPGKNAEKLDILNRGTEVTVIGKTWVSGELWYCVEVNGMTGYLNSSMLEVLDGDVVPEM